MVTIHEAKPTKQKLQDPGRDNGCLIGAYCHSEVFEHENDISIVFSNGTEIGTFPSSESLHQHHTPLITIITLIT